jgi:hypothetical protein
MKKTKLLILLGFMSLMTGAYACKTVIITTPTGTTVCYICADGKLVNCAPL